MLVLVALAALPPISLTGPQDRTRYELTRHLVLYHTLVLEPNLFDRALFHGRTYSDKAPGMSFLAVPAFELERVAGVAKAPRGWEAKGDPSLWLIRVLTSGVLFMLSVFVVGRLGERIVAGTGAATAAIFGVATLATSLAPTFFEHDAAGAFAIAAFAFAWLGRRPAALALAGFCAGTAVLFQYATGFVALALLAYAAWRHGRRALWFLLGAAPPAIALGAYDWAAFGSPFHVSYRYVRNAYTESQHHGFFGIGVPTLGGVKDVLVGTRGLLYFSPVLVAAAVGLWLLYRRGLARRGAARGSRDGVLRPARCRLLPRVRRRHPGPAVPRACASVPLSWAPVRAGALAAPDARARLRLCRAHDRGRTQLGSASLARDHLVSDPQRDLEDDLGVGRAGPQCRCARRAPLRARGCRRRHGRPGAPVKRLIALPGAAAFLVCCLVTRGGLLDHHRYGDAALYGHYAHEMTSGHWPYRDFFDEYPVLAQPLFFLVRVLPGPFITTFKWTMALCGAAALVLLVHAMRGPLLRMVAAAAAVAVSPLLIGPVFLNTYDLFPALLTIAAVLAWLRERERTAYLLLALAVAAKVYPLVLLPLALIESWERGGRDALRRALVWFGGVLVLVHLPFAVLGPGGLRFSYWVQLKRGLEAESLGAGILLVLDRLGVYSVTLRDEAPGSRDAVGTVPNAVAILSSLAVLAAVLYVAWIYLHGSRDRLLACATAVTAFVAFGKVLSPQYLTWLVGIVPGAGIVASGILVVALALTRAEWDRFAAPHGSVHHWGEVLSWWVLARDLVLVALFAWLVLKLRAGARPRSLR